MFSVEGECQACGHKRELARDRNTYECNLNTVMYITCRNCGAKWWKLKVVDVESGDGAGSVILSPPVKPGD